MRLRFGATASQVKKLRVSAISKAPGAIQWTASRRRVRCNQGRPVGEVEPLPPTPSPKRGGGAGRFLSPSPLRGGGWGEGFGSGAASIAAPVRAGGVIGCPQLGHGTGGAAVSDSVTGFWQIGRASCR